MVCVWKNILPDIKMDFGRSGSKDKLKISSGSKDRGKAIIKYRCRNVDHVKKN